MSKRIQTGDVIKAKNGWEFGERTSRGSAGTVVTVSDSPSEHHRHVVNVINPDASPRQIAEGTAPRYIESTHRDAFDESRPSAKFVVTRAEAAGGGTGHGPHDVYPDGWEVVAKRLHVDGSYDPDGETILFYQTGQLGSHCYTCQADAEVIGKMRRITTWVPEAQAVEQAAKDFLKDHA